MPDKLDNTKELQRFLGIVNYTKSFIKYLGKIAGPLYARTGSTGQKYFNTEDIKLVQKIKDRIKNIPDLYIPLETGYLVIETDGSLEGWGAVLKEKRNKYSNKSEEKICDYQSGKYKEKGNMSNIDAEILVVIYGLNSFRLYILNEPKILIRTDCEAIIKFHQKINEKNSSRRRWLNFVDTISIYNLIFGHIKGKNNNLADQLSKLKITIN